MQNDQNIEKLNPNALETLKPASSETPGAPETVENRLEHALEQVTGGIEKSENAAGPEMKAGGIVAQSQQRRAESERIKAIERVLEKDLDELYLAMPADRRQIFREQGELTCRKISELLETGKATVKKVVMLIRQWLSYIPGVNQYFLEQEAKIKADEIIGMIG